ncbi:MAG: hypothetical protein ACYDCQ_21405 [Dehalococcoidia bacterium]
MPNLLAEARVRPTGHVRSVGRTLDIIETNGMPSALRRQTLTREQRDTAVAQALLHLGDIPWLADSPLVRLPAVQARCRDDSRLFADGRALQARLQEGISEVLRDLEGDGALARWRVLLTGVRDGKSISGVARELGLTREHVSRTYWPPVVRLVAQSLTALPNPKAGPYTGGKGAK